MAPLQGSTTARKYGPFLALPMAFMVGCVTEESTDTTGAGGAAPALQLTCTSDHFELKIGAQSAAAGNAFLVVELNLQNMAVASPLSLAQPLFYAEMVDHLTYSASFVSALLPNYCQATQFVSIGGTGSCALAFETPESAVPQTLRYDDLLGHVADAPMPLPPQPTPCEIREQWSGTACSDCLNGAACSSERQAWMASSQYSWSPCYEARTDAHQACPGLGSTELGCCFEQALPGVSPDPSCVPLLEAWLSCLNASCNAACK